MNKAEKSFDLVIAGGGAVGLTLALAIAQQSQLNVAVIEANERPEPQNKSENSPKSTNSNADNCTSNNDSFLDLRSVALSAQSTQILGALGLTSLSKFGCPISHIHVSDKGHLGRSSLHAQDYHLDALGQVIELPVLVELLQNEIKAYAQQVTFYFGQSIDQLHKSADYVELVLGDKQRLKASLLVIAEGGNSPTREKSGIDTQLKDYQQSAIVANVALFDDHNNTAFERFTPDGPLALLPLKPASQHPGSYRSSLVWTLSRSQCESVLALSDKDFIARLQDEFGYRLGKIKAVGNRSAFPLVQSRALQHIQHRTALLGNACQTLHPIAGQGLNLGLRDVYELVQIILSNQSSDKTSDIGSYSGLQCYQQNRKNDQARLIGATDLLVHTFSNRYPPLVIGRNLALGILDSHPRLKQILAHHAMGFHGTSGKSHAKL
ncbi:2-octaprenyl-6-methoxyphenyl hydroxylase [Aliiglaciecola sp. SL4]|uniref:2-octaprenyl-6-methoxyphenyl hydroxylase n=1 Tax=Aliiglaciecola sp. SL4 TaxID=3239806 RepID=UPI00355B8A93